MKADELQLSIDELAERVGLGVRTIRYYISEGLLPGPGARGKAAAYDATHLARLSLIRRLTDQRVPLKEIRDRLVVLTDTDVSTLLTRENRNEAALRQASLSASPKDYIASLLEQAGALSPRATAVSPRHGQAQMPSVARGSSDVRGSADATDFDQRKRSRSKPATWRHFELTPGIEIHVRDDVADSDRDLVERLLALGESMLHDQHDQQP